MKCPRCQADVEGRFCGFCGAVLEARRCPACEHRVPPGHRYCGECGAEQAEDGVAVPRRARPVRAAADGGSRTGWWVAGGLALLTAAILIVPSIWSQWPDTGAAGERVPMGEPMGGAGPAPNVDLSSMTPREAADRLFDRVMRAMAANDDDEVATFLPMALDAYALAEPLDADGHFHLSLLQRAGGQYRDALDTAERVLDTEPDHLLARYAAGESAAALGQTERAEAHYRHLLEVFDAESARGLPEYQEHASFLPVIREVARDFLATEGD